MLLKDYRATKFPCFYYGLINYAYHVGISAHYVSTPGRSRWAFDDSDFRPYTLDCSVAATIADHLRYLRASKDYL